MHRTRSDSEIQMTHLKDREESEMTRGNHDTMPALILGFGVHGLAIARSLGRRGIHVESMDIDPTQPHAKSRYCKILHRVESLEDDRLIRSLMAYAESTRVRTALFLTMDRTVPVIARHREMLARHYSFNLPSDATIHSLMDKSALPVFLDHANASYPRTYRIGLDTNIERIASDIDYPCIVKPSARAYGFKAGVANSLSEFLPLIARAMKHAPELVAQQLIPGADTDVHFCFVYIAKDGTPHATFTGHKIRQLPRGTGIAASAEALENTYLRDETLRLFAIAGYRGFGSSEFRRDPRSGQYYLIEFTVGRTDYNVGCAVANGIDLPYVGYCDLAGLSPASVGARASRKRRWVELDREVTGILTQGAFSGSTTLENLRALAQSLSPRNAFTMYAADDVRPSMVDIWQRLTWLPRAAIRRTARALQRSGNRKISPR